MVDITKDEYWEVDYEIKVNKDKKRASFDDKILTILCITLILFIGTNGILVYKFFKILLTL